MATRTISMFEDRRLTLNTVVLNALRHGPMSRPEIEACAAEAGFAPAGVPRVLWQLRKTGQVVHTQRAGRHRQSRYEVANAN